MQLDIKFLNNKKIKFTVEKDEIIKVGGSLYLSGTSITALPDNLTVGGYLDLSGTSITALPDNLTVGGSLDLRGTSITALPDNLTVGGSLYLSGTSITAPKKRNELPDGFYASIILSVELRFNARGFTIADNILARILQARGALKKIIIYGQKTESWLATDDKGNSAHGKTAAEAAEELGFKLADKGDFSDIKNMPLETVKTPHEWSLVYRRATGACKMGVESFMTEKVKKEQYTLAEILKETAGKFGHQKFKDVVNG